jgi:hypothetical protein
MAYVDLNPVRARVVDRPERSRQTGVRARIVARQRHHAARRIRAQWAQAATAILKQQDLTAAEAGPEVGLWLAPLARCCVAAAAASGGSIPAEARRRAWSADDYLRLVDLSGRVLRGGKRGAIPADLAPLLARLNLDVDAWVAVLFSWRSFVGRAIGSVASRTVQAGKLGLQWIQNRCPLFVARTAA